jgi:hypothetical protein
MMGQDFTTNEITAVKSGGLAGIFGSLLLVTVFGFLAILVGDNPVDAHGMIELFPEIKTVRIVENVFYLFCVALWALHAVTMFLVLRRGSFALALAGCVMAVLGLAILATGAIPHTATAPLSDLYHAVDATPENKAMLVVAWQVVQGLVDALVVTGLVLTPLGMGLFGLAMLRSPTYGIVAGWIGIVLGLVGAVSAGMILFESDEMAAVGIFALVFFNIIIGWRTFRIARVGQTAPAIPINENVGRRSGQSSAGTTPTSAA